MRNWSLPFNAPLTLTLAADSRFGGFDPNDDQIWELSVSTEEPRGVALKTTYGMRAKSMRILPVFELNGERRHDPAKFHSPPLIHTWLPNYISVVWRAFAEIEVTAEYWAHDSALVAGRYSFFNLSEGSLEPGLSLYSVLEPGANPLPMSSERVIGVEILSGQTAELRPVLFIEGGARSEPAPYPALGVKTLLPPGAKHSWIWAHCGSGSVHDGFKRCRELAVSDWDANVARQMMASKDFVDIETGNQDWDAAFWAAQREAQSLFIKPHRKLEGAVPVCSRSIKDGSSSAGSREAWEPASPWEMYYAALQILPVAAWRAEGLIETLLRLQEANGHIPVLTNFTTIHEGWLYPPLLSRLAWEVYESTGRAELIKEGFYSLAAFFDCWFSADHDRDEDGFPEWDHVNQAGFKTWPAFCPWFEWAQGLDLSKAETIDLASHLFLEGEALLKIASVADRAESLGEVRQRLETLRDRIEESWKQGSGYRHVDFYLHESVPGKRLGLRRGSFSLDVNQAFDPAARVLLKIEGPEEEAHDLRVRIHSRGRRGPGRVEKLNFRNTHWFLDLGFVTSEKPSAEIEKIEVQGLDRKFRTTVSVADFTRKDLTLLLPIKAGIPSIERANAIVREIIMNPDLYWRENGLPSVPADDPAYDSDLHEEGGSIDLLLNHWVGEGLLRYGYRREAADLLDRLMKPVIGTLKREHKFSARYHPDGEKSYHDSSGIAGLAPFALFLKILGVEFITPTKVRIQPGNPFKEPVRLQWRGAVVLCEADRTIVTFPDGGVVEITGEMQQLVEQLK